MQPLTTKYTLRPYQAKAVKAAVEYLTTRFYDGPGLLVLPTGAGKSLVLAGIVNELDGPCIVLQPSKELVEQNAEKMRSYGYEPAIYSASLGIKEVGTITLATIGSIIRKVDEFRHFKYILIDECDLVNAKGGLYKQLLNELSGARVIGCTATPYRLSTDGFGGSILKFLTRTRPRVFTHVIDLVQNGDLFEERFLCKLAYKEIDSGIDRTQLKLNSTGADYDDSSVRRHFDKINFREEVVKAVKFLMERNGRKGILIFTRFVEEAQYVQENIPNCELVTADTKPDERRRIIEDFKAGKIWSVVNVGVLSVGFDFPALSTVVLARPTMSLRLYYQQIGRAVRTHPGKDEAWIVDMVGLVQQFGIVEDLKLVCGKHETWSVESRGKQLTNVYFGKPPERKFQARKKFDRYSKQSNWRF